MDVATVALLVVVAVLLVMILMRVRRDENPVSRGAPASVQEVVPVGQGGLLAVEEPNGAIAIRPEGSSEPVLYLEPIPEVLSGNANLSARSAAPVPATFLAGLGTIGGAVHAMWDLTKSPGGWIAHFPPKVEALIRSGKATPVPSAGGQLAVARDAVSNKFVGVARISGPAGPAISSQGLLAMGGIAAVILVELEQIKAALKEINQRLQLITERLRDADYGVLKASESLIARLAPVLVRGSLPSQYARELAVARMDVDAVYFSRQHYISRLLEHVEMSQDRLEQKKRESKAWAKGVTDAFGDQEYFEAEVLLYAHSMVTRSRLTLLSAAALALDGHPDEGLAAFRAEGSELRDSFHRLLRHLAALRDHPPSLLWLPVGNRKQIYEKVTAAADVLEGAVDPFIPSRSASEDHGLSARFLPLPAGEGG